MKAHIRNFKSLCSYLSLVKEEEKRKRSESLYFSKCMDVYRRNEL